MRRNFKKMLARQTVYIPRGPVARETVVTLKYYEAFNNAAGAIDQRFRLNSIFDPNLTGTGHQPLGYDQYSTFYGRYRVTDVTMVFTGAMDPSVATYPCRMTIFADNNTNPYTDQQTGTEQNSATSSLITSNSVPLKVVKRFNLARVAGVDKKSYADDRFQSVFGTNPSEEIILHVLGTRADGSSADAGAIKYAVVLYMKVHLFDPLVVPGS